MGKSIGVELRRDEEVNTEEKREKLINEYKTLWNCDQIHISQPDQNGIVMIRQIPEVDMIEISN